MKISQGAKFNLKASYNGNNKKDIDISSPNSITSVLHVSHTDGSSVSTIVRRLEEKLNATGPTHDLKSSAGHAVTSAAATAAHAAVLDIPTPPPPPAVVVVGSSPSGGSSGKRPNKFIAKLMKPAAAQQPAEEFVMSSPSNFQHNAHVDNDYNWGPDPQKVLKLGAVLGQGAYGQVLEAKYINTNYLMALKIIPTFKAGKNVDDVSHEINVLRRCRHPNIVSYFGSATTSNELWIMMEYCMHGSMATIVDTFKAVDKQFTERELAHVLHQAIKGLAYLHNDRIKVIHRDLKCGNILVGEDGVVKLADFGISFQQTGSRSKAATLIGTPLFMSPEMLSGDPYNSKTDIWSLGITAIEMADGVPPYFKDHQMRALYRIMHEDPPTLADPQRWSPQFVSFISACLQKDPAHRLSAAALLDHEFLRQVKPDETKTVMRQLLQQFEEARRELQRRRLAGGPGGDLVLNFNGGGGGLTTLSTLSTAAGPPGDAAPAGGFAAAWRAGGCGLTTTSVSVVQLRSSSSAPTLSSYAHPPDAAAAAAADGVTTTTTSEEDEAYGVDSGSISGGSDGDQQDGELGSAPSDELSSGGRASRASKKGTKRKSGKTSKKKTKKGEKANNANGDATLGDMRALGRQRSGALSRVPADNGSGSSSTASGAQTSPVDRRATLTMMHAGQSSLAFFTGLSRGAQQLLSSNSGSAPTTPRTLEQHLQSDPDEASDAEGDAQPRTMAELARLVGEESVDAYMAMPLVQLIYELHQWKSKHALLAEELQALKGGGA